MMQQQTVTGFFDSKEDAQQAVQHLLGSGFTAEQISISDQRPPQTHDRAGASPSGEEPTSGRFLSSLFWGEFTNPEQTDSAGEVSYTGSSLVTIRVQTPPEADRATGLLKRAGAVNVSKTNSL